MVYQNIQKSAKVWVWVYMYIWEYISICKLASRDVLVLVIVMFIVDKVIKMADNNFYLQFFAVL